MIRRHIIWWAIFIALAAALLISWQTQRVVESHREGPMDPVERAYEVIAKQAYPSTPPTELQRGAIRGMIESLNDPNSHYLTPEQAKTVCQHVQHGRAFGTGIVLDPANPTRLLGVRPFSPAHKADLYAGQVLQSVNSQPVTGKTVKEIMTMLDNPQNQPLTLIFSDELAGAQKKRTLTLSSAEYPLQTVRGIDRPDRFLNRSIEWIWEIPSASMTNRFEKTDYHYIRITEFCPETMTQLRGVLKSISDSGGLVLDLRGNPGGLLECAAAAADLFLDGGVIATTISRDGDRDEQRAHAEGTWNTKVPIVILIDSDTASAAEILAGSLAEYGRAVVLGERTKGKGTVQSLIDLPENLGKISITTAEFFIAEDIPIQKYPKTASWGVSSAFGAIPLPEPMHSEWKTLREKMDILRNMPENIHIPALTTPHGAEMLKVDIPLQQAVEMLKDPEKYKALTDAAKAKRQIRLDAKARQAATQEAGK